MRNFWLPIALLIATAATLNAFRYEIVDADRYGAVIFDRWAGCLFSTHTQLPSSLTGPIWCKNSEPQEK